jgi:hypothetical protein
MKKSLVLVVLAGMTASAGLSLAQELIPAPPFGGEIRVTPIGGQGGGYTGRAIQDVYDNYTGVFGNGGVYFLGNNNMIAEDISFVGSPWNGVTGRVITEMTYTVVVLGSAPAGPEDIIVNFWDEDDVIYTGTSGTDSNMINPSAVPIASYRIDSTGLTNGFIWALTNAVNVPIPDDDNGVFIQVAWVQDGAVPAVGWHDMTGILYEPCPSGNIRGLAFSSYSLAGPGGNPATVGSTALSYGRDMLTATMCAHAGILMGNTGPVTGGNNEHRQIVANIPATGGTPKQLGYVMRLRGDVPPPPPPPAEDLGCLADGTTTVNNAGGTAVKWYQFCLNNAAADLDLKVLNIDSEGSASDVAIGLFDTSGGLASVDSADNDDGSGVNAQLTYGVGRLAAVGDGRQYDGRDGQLAAGTYYLAVAPGGSTFGGGYTVNSAGTNGAFTLNFFTNVNGTPLPPAVQPDTSFDYDGLFGPIGTPDSRQGVGEASGLRGVRWWRFSTTFNAGSGDSYLDIDFARLSTATADGVAYIFDANGEVVAFNDDDGDGLLPMFSFGVGSAARTYPPAVTSYSGQSGSLPAGQYFIAAALFPTQDIVVLGGNDRFHVRGTSGSNLTVGADIYTGGTPAVACDPDVNCDGSADGFDVEVMEQAVGGDLSNFCQVDPDFNRDGSVDGFDVETVEQVVGGSPCP